MQLDELSEESQVLSPDRITEFWTFTFILFPQDVQSDNPTFILSTS